VLFQCVELASSYLVALDRVRLSMEGTRVVDGCEARAGIESWIRFYNLQRPHQALENRTPMAVFRPADGDGEIGKAPVDMTLQPQQQTRVA